jgi:hypothetical protein
MWMLRGSFTHQRSAVRYRPRPPVFAQTKQANCRAPLSFLQTLAATPGLSASRIETRRWSYGDAVVSASATASTAGVRVARVSRNVSRMIVPSAIARTATPGAP